MSEDEILLLGIGIGLNLMLLLWMFFDARDSRRARRQLAADRQRAAL